MREIRLTHGYIALVDDEDFERFGHLKWTAQIQTHRPTRHVYAYRNERQPNGKLKNIYLHRVIMNAPAGVRVDHRESNQTLDCRRSNLRLATAQQNAWNSKRRPPKSGFLGVEPLNKGWRGRVHVAGHTRYTRTFSDPVQAAFARDVLASRLHGEFAVLNFRYLPLLLPPIQSQQERVA